MSLKTTPVSKCLDKKLIIFGFEVLDLLAIFLTLSLLNFIFGRSGFKIVLIWLPSVALAVLLRVSKRNKPENYLMHWLRFQFRPGVWSAFVDASTWTPLPNIQKGILNESTSTGGTT